MATCEAYITEKRALTKFYLRLLHPVDVATTIIPIPESSWIG